MSIKRWRKRETSYTVLSLQRGQKIFVIFSLTIHVHETLRKTKSQVKRKIAMLTEHDYIIKISAASKCRNIHSNKMFMATPKQPGHFCCVTCNEYGSKLFKVV